MEESSAMNETRTACSTTSFNTTKTIVRLPGASIKTKTTTIWPCNYKKSAEMRKGKTLASSNF